MLTLGEGMNSPISSIPTLSIPKKMAHPYEPIPRPRIPRKLLALLRHDKPIPTPMFPKTPPQWSYLDQKKLQKTSSELKERNSAIETQQGTPESSTTASFESQDPDYALRLTPSISPTSVRKQSIELSRRSTQSSPRRQGTVHVRMFTVKPERT